MTRKLLPYEYELIDALGISKEEYLDFVAALPVYEDCKEGTVTDIRNATATVALVLTIVGILFQVGAALLAPKPSTTIDKTKAEGAAQSRDQRVSPRYGFNGVQELANYGDPVPLIYTNVDHNPKGGVRVNTALLWSAILSFGGNQFMRLLTSIGAGTIGEIDIYRSALGQLPLRDYTESNIWAYFNGNDFSKYSQLANTTNTFDDPTRVGSTNRPTARLTTLAGRNNEFGFSQAYAPTTSVACGVTGVIPINVDTMIINPAGYRKREPVGTSLSPRGSYWAANGTRQNVREGDEFVLKIQTTKRIDLKGYREKVGQVLADAIEASRRAEAATLFEGARFKIGSAILRIISLSNTETDEGAVTARFRCERSGRFPSIPYGIRHWLQVPTASISRQKGIIRTEEAKIDSLDEDKKALNAYLKPGVWATNSPEWTAFNEAQQKYDQFIKGRRVTKKAVRRMVSFVNASIKESKQKIAAAQAELQKLEERDKRLKDTIDNSLYTKCLAHIEEAHYATTTQCHVVDFALKARAYRRLSGRSDVYGTDQVDHSDSSAENGLQPRVVMFRMYWRFAGETRRYTSVPYIFCIRGTTEQDIFTYIKLIHANAAFTEPKGVKYWEVRFEPVLEPGTERNISKYCYLQQNGAEVRLSAGTSDTHVMFSGTVYDFTSYPPINVSADYTNEWDLFNYDSNAQSQFSFDQGPEISITAVTEQLLEPWTNYGPDLYKGLSTLGLHVFASKSTESLRSISVWVNKGKLLRPLSTNPRHYNQQSEIRALVKSSPSSSSSYAPDIFLDTILDEKNGIGQFADIHSVDVPQLATTKLFCQKNNLFMDGVIADQRSWREFWSQTAPFSLLELARIGGRDTLVPGVPYNPTTGRIDANIAVSALFTAGNILEDSYKEEFLDYGANVQDTIVTAIYRDTETNDVFPRNASVDVYLKETNPNTALLETLDLSQFVTRRSQAILLAKFLCLSKHYVRRAIEFKTFPTDTPISPGAYIYVEIGLNQWNSIYSGRIESNGFLNAPLPRQIPNGTYTVFIYRAGAGTYSVSNVTVFSGYARQLKSYEGAMFALGQSIRNKRVFRVTEVGMDEEGEVTVKAVEHPTDDNGRSKIAERLLESNQFYVDGQLS